MWERVKMTDRMPNNDYDGRKRTCHVSKQAPLVDCMNPLGSPASVAAPALEPIPAPSTSGTTRSSVGKRKRSHPTTDLATVFAQMHGDEVQFHEWQLELHREALAQHMQAINQLADDAREGSKKSPLEGRR
ncbi:uncharacterized protein KZ484_019568 isoform 1-T3 [Pholidichthys leucotaenia]